jgi:hypothetical protein
MAPRRASRAWVTAAVLVLSGFLSACMPEPGATPSPSSADASSTPEPSPSPTSTSAVVQIPADCRAILSAGVLEELRAVTLNDPALGASGPQPDGSLICVWGDPATATHLTTTLTYVSRGPALDMLNGLLSEGFACYNPDGGTRCEKTWFSDPDLLPQGRTLFWRQDVLIDTQFSSLAPEGYTAAIVANLFG